MRAYSLRDSGVYRLFGEFGLTKEGKNGIINALTEKKLCIGTVITMQHRRRVSRISAMHFFKLALRSVLFLGACGIYIANRILGLEDVFDEHQRFPWLLILIWVIYAVEMALRFFPSRLESPGCQKQFARTYCPTGQDKPVIQPAWRTAVVAAVWLLLNACIGALYLTELIDAGILILVSLAYGVCDMICILFFCPFQTWLMKNRCCTDCRIYNWDFAMMFTPLILLPHWYTWSLLGLSLALLLRWELTLRLHPERFSQATNAAISCQNCTEKLCRHKRQLAAWIRDRKFIRR